MYSGAKLFEVTQAYCRMVILEKECKWYEFTKKKIYRDEANWLYPLMKGEIKALSPNLEK